MAIPPDEPLMAVAEVVSDALETPIEELPPLSESVDLEGVDRLVTDHPSHDVTITFSYAGLRVLVHSGPTVYVRPLRADEGDKR